MMDVNSTESTVSSVYSACLLGYRNGSYPDGTKGGGTFAFGLYSPTAAERTACQVGNEPWGASGRYALWTMYVVGGYFGVVAVFNHLSAWAKHNRSRGRQSFFSWPGKVTSSVRAVDMRRLHTKLPTTGTLLVSLGLLVFGNVVCFAIRPYYRPPNFGSSPLGLRSEWVSTALIVWVVATGVKRNALSALSGMPYVRLLDYHKTLGWACCFFAGVHTVAMMIRVERQGAPWSYTWETSPISYGWAAWGSLVSLFWLCVASLGPIRRLSHEWFYVLHMAGVLLFIVFMYYHCFDALVSWPLMHAATVVLGAAVVYRFVQLFVSKHAVVEVIADGALRIRVDVRYRFVWTAGQHVFVRFTSPALAPWQTHPFTVANVPAHSLVAVDAGHPLASADVEKQAPGTAVATAPERPSSASSTLDLVLRPHSGLTRRLFERASAAPGGRFTAPVVLDGPYSSDSSDQLSVSASDRALVVAGGTGLSYALPLILVALGGTRGQAPSEPLRAVDVAWAVRHASCVEWYSEMLARTQAIAHARGVDLSITLYVSRPGPDDGEMSGTATASSASSSKAASDGIKVVHGRPDGAALIKAAAELSARRLVVVSCGPQALALSVRNAATAEQLQIIRGRSAVKELELVEEVYDC